MFLRARREATTPAAVGLAAGPRRRTPGLRRSEVATLADVSVEYLVRLEQGRHHRPSAQVLSAIAEALRLTARERVHLYRLSKGADPGFACRGPDAQPGRAVRATVRALLDRLDPAPAVLINRLTELVGWTAGYQRLAEPTGLLDGTPPSLARFVFTDGRARGAFPDWARVADEHVALLKQGPFRADAHVAALADELAVIAGADFTDRVATVPGLPTPNGVTRLIHPVAGSLRLAYEMLDLPADDDQRLIVYLPADEATSAALDRLRLSAQSTMVSSTGRGEKPSTRRAFAELKVS
jgi:transcriptional regulator with XRE-family HTH domain